MHWNNTRFLITRMNLSAEVFALTCFLSVRMSFLLCSFTDLLKTNLAIIEASRPTHAWCTTNGMCAKNRTYIYVVRTSNNRVSTVYGFYCCLLPQCEALRGPPIATLCYKKIIKCLARSDLITGKTWKAAKQERFRCFPELRISNRNGISIHLYFIASDLPTACQRWPRISESTPACFCVFLQTRIGSHVFFSEAASVCVAFINVIAEVQTLLHFGCIDDWRSSNRSQNFQICKNSDPDPDSKFRNRSGFDSENVTPAASVACLYVTCCCLCLIEYLAE